MSTRAPISKRLVGAGALILLTVAVLAIGWSLSRSSAPSVSAATRLEHPLARAHSPAPAAGEGSHIRAGQRRVSDTLSWHIISSHTSHSIENAYLSSNATGIYLIVDVVAVNNTDHAVPLSGAQVDLGATRYRLDANALSALELAGHKGLSGTLDAAATATGWLVFDVRPGAAASSPLLCLDPPASHGSTASAGCSA
jgi:hypothetical protein